MGYRASAKGNSSLIDALRPLKRGSPPAPKTGIKTRIGSGLEDLLFRNVGSYLLLHGTIRRTITRPAISVR